VASGHIVWVSGLHALKERLTHWKGRVKREVGEATGDRRVEAEGAIETLGGRKADPGTVDAATEDIRAKHGDVLPDRGPEPR
jgi:uncharacterized protein YjbJ (UPF0337 family)